MKSAKKKTKSVPKSSNERTLKKFEADNSKTPNKKDGIFQGDVDLWTTVNGGSHFRGPFYTMKDAITKTPSEYSDLISIFRSDEERPFFEAFCPVDTSSRESIEKANILNKNCSPFSFGGENEEFGVQTEPKATKAGDTFIVGKRYSSVHDITNAKTRKCVWADDTKAILLWEEGNMFDPYVAMVATHKSINSWEEEVKAREFTIKFTNGFIVLSGATFEEGETVVVKEVLK